MEIIIYSHREAGRLSRCLSEILRGRVARLAILGMNRSTYCAWGSRILTLIFIVEDNLARIRFF